jgi:hypothetical protein
MIRRGAVIATGIYVGSARAMSTLLYKYWPSLTHKILQHFKQSHIPCAENRITPDLAQEALRAASRPFWDRPRWLSLRALRVAHCGWNSLSSTEAIERVTAPQPDLPNSATNATIRALCNKE